MLETVRLSLDALRAHKLRSFLTLLGVILAVTTLVAVMSVVAGLNFYVADKIANLGANVYVLTRFGIITRPGRLGEGAKAAAGYHGGIYQAEGRHAHRKPGWLRCWVPPRIYAMATICCRM